MIIPYIQVIVGLILLYFGAEWLVSGAVKLALRLGISALAVGLTVVAFGTSAPELFVGLNFHILAGETPAALGNVIGSNICNIALVLGFGALLYPIAIEKKLVKREVPILILVTLGFVFAMENGIIGRLEGILCLLGIIIYTVWCLRTAKAHPEDAALAPEVEEIAQAPEKGGIGLSILLILGGTAVLAGGAKLLETGAITIATQFRISEAIIGLTIVAFGTSLPELATAVVAAKKKEGDILAGNVVGSCIFNILLIIGASATLKPMIVADIYPIDLWYMLGLSLLLIPVMTSAWRVARTEGALLLAVYVSYIYLLAQRADLV